MSVLRGLEAAKLSYTLNQAGVWRDAAWSRAEVHAEARARVMRSYQRLEAEAWAEDGNPPGQVLVGEAGAGKTHALGQLRAEVCARGGVFWLADLTDVRDFWETVLAGAVDSLTRSLPGGGRQLDAVLDAVIAAHGDDELRALGAAGFAKLRPPKLANKMRKLIQRAGKQREAQPHLSLLSALLLRANEASGLFEVGEAWLLGEDVREEAQLIHELPRERSASRRLAGLSYWTQLRGPILLAIDQIDAITSEAKASAEGDPVRGIFEGTLHGLMGLWDKLSRTQLVLSALEANWAWTQGHASLASLEGRFASPIRLRPQPGGVLRPLIEARLAVGHAQAGVTPPYPSYPLRPSCFEGLNLSPRQALIRLAAHRDRCLEAGAVIELDQLVEAAAKTASPHTAPGLDAQLDELAAASQAPALLDLPPNGGAENDRREQALDQLLETAVEALAVELDLPAQDYTTETELRFEKIGTIAPLHARLRVVSHAKNDRARSLSLRFVQHDHHRALQNRLEKARIKSGIDEGLGFRRLLLFRRGAYPNTAATQTQVQQLKDRGAQLIDLSDAELRRLDGLRQLMMQQPADLQAWLRDRRPVSQLPCFSAQLDFLRWQAPVLSSPPPRQPDLRGLQPHTQARGARPPVQPDLFTHAVTDAGPVDPSPQAPRPLPPPSPAPEAGPATSPGTADHDLRPTGAQSAQLPDPHPAPTEDLHPGYAEATGHHPAATEDLHPRYAETTGHHPTPTEDPHPGYAETADLPDPEPPRPPKAPTPDASTSAPPSVDLHAQTDDLPLSGVDLHAQTDDLPLSGVDLHAPTAEVPIPSAPASAPPVAEPHPGHRTATKHPDPADAAPTAPELQLGQRWRHGQANGAARLPLSLLRRHIGIVGMSGSGKTVLIRRLVEEAACLGVPAIVLDVGGDLATLGLRGPAADPSDPFYTRSQTVIWTPGDPEGNPLSTNPLPELFTAANDPALRRVVVEQLAQDLKLRDDVQRAILNIALEILAHQGGGLPELAELLDDAELSSAFSNGAKVQTKLRDLILSAHQLDRYGRDGADLDIAQLLGHGQAKTRISVISLQKLDAAAQLSFVAGLSRRLFRYAKQHPQLDGRGGLLVVDEAQTFVPSQRSTASKDALQTLAEQLRKYGYGLVFATQAPKNLDHKVIGNCATLLFGRTSSPAATRAVQEFMSNLKRSGGDTTGLRTGAFVLSTEGQPPTRIQVQPCRSPTDPPEPAEVQLLAARTRAALRRQAP